MRITGLRASSTLHAQPGMFRWLSSVLICVLKAIPNAAQISGKGGAALDSSNPFLSMSSEGAGSMLMRTKSSALDVLNASQASAMGAFYAAGTAELHCVVGPPGTGKTTALSALLKVSIVTRAQRREGLLSHFHVLMMH